MPSSSSRRLRSTLVAGIVALLTGLGVVGLADADLNTRIEGRAGKAERLRAAIASQTRQIKASAPALAAAERRLDRLSSSNARAQERLEAVQSDLRRSRRALTRLIGRQRASSEALARNLDATYRTGRPDIVSVLVEADGFAQLLEQVTFFKRVAKRNGEILDSSRRARGAVTRQTASLARTQADEKVVASRLARRTEQAQVLQTALLRAQQARLRSRASGSEALRSIEGELEKLRRQLASSAQNGIKLKPGGEAQAPAGAPRAVELVVAAGNAISGLPYLYGGGHAGFKDTAYDCSGSISYALAAAGLVSSPMASGGFMSWGESGPGKYITIYTNPGHMFMMVGDWRYDTTALRSGGSRWTRGTRSTAGFIARHPPGL